MKTGERKSAFSDAIDALNAEESREGTESEE